MQRLNISNKKKVEISAEVPVEISPKPLVLDVPVNETKEEKIISVDPGDFIVDEKESNLFYNIKNRSFSIRVLKGRSNRKERDKDQLIFATSLPHMFSAFTLKAMQNYVPQLTDLDFSKSHELLITKSAASKFDDLQDSILRFIFLRLNREYKWLFEQQTVIVELVPNRHVLTFNLKVQTIKHLDLGRALFEINGISTQMAGEPFPLCMDHKNTYDFNLEKGKAFSWDELLPEIKEVFVSHFPAGVKFTGNVMN
ncbi:MAG: hypothetical protein WC467_02395 [Patescibacteria group bacterium]